MASHQNLPSRGLPRLQVWTGAPIEGSTHWEGVPSILSGVVEVAAAGRMDTRAATVRGENDSARLDVSDTLNHWSGDTSTLFRLDPVRTALALRLGAAAAR